MEQVSEAGYVVQLGDLANIRIGIVTGANSFFVIDEAKANEHGLPDEALRPVLAKFAMAPGAVLTRADLASIRAKGGRLLLVDTDHADLAVKGSNLRDYLATFPRPKRHTNKTFRKRKLWHRPDDDRPPDAFFPYMYQHGPRLILNEVGTTSTNTIHRVYFKDDSLTIFEDIYSLRAEVSAAERIRLSTRGWRRTFALSILSTFSQLSGELHGRSYGAGVLKHEPSEAARIQLIIPRPRSENAVDATFREVDGLLRGGDFDAAKALADYFVLNALPSNERKRVCAVLGAALKEARRRRRPSRKVERAMSTAQKKHKED